MEPLLTGVIVPVNLISSAPSDPEFAGGGVHRTAVQRTNVTRIKIIRCVFRSKGTFKQGSIKIEIQNAVRLFFPVRVVKRREEICRVSGKFRLCRTTLEQWRPYPKSVSGNDEGLAICHGAPKRIPDARRGGGSKTSCNPKPTDQFP